jgi:hypothetical protein
MISLKSLYHISQEEKFADLESYLEGQTLMMPISVPSTEV